MKKRICIIGISAGLGTGIIMALVLLGFSSIAVPSCLLIGIFMGTSTTFAMTFGCHNMIKAISEAFKKAGFNEKNHEMLLCVIQGLKTEGQELLTGLRIRFIDNPAQLRSSVIARKKIIGYLAVILLSSVGSIINWHNFNKALLVSRNDLPLFIFGAVAVVFLLSVIGAVTSSMILSGIIFLSLMNFVAVEKDGFVRWNPFEKVQNTESFFWLGWFHALLAYDGPAFKAVCHMLKIRSINVARVLIFPFFFIGALLLIANQKARLSTITTCLLLSLEFGLSYHFGWLTQWYANINFWLCTGTVIMIGLMIGNLVDRKQPKTAVLPKLHLDESLYDFFHPMQFKKPE